MKTHGIHRVGWDGARVRHFSTHHDIESILVLPREPNAKLATVFVACWGVPFPTFPVFFVSTAWCSGPREA